MFLHSFLGPKAPPAYMIVLLIMYSNLQILTTITIDEPAPGIKSIFTIAVPDQSSGKVIAPYPVFSNQSNTSMHHQS